MRMVKSGLAVQVRKHWDTKLLLPPAPRSAPRVAAQLIRKLNAFFERLERSVWKTATRFLENCNAVF